jgi:hypothetical protein
MEYLGIFYGHCGSFKSIWCIVPPFGILCGNLIYILPLWYVRKRKIWQPCAKAVSLEANFVRITGSKKSKLISHRDAPVSNI